MKEEERALLRAMAAQLGKLARGEAPATLSGPEETDAALDALRDVVNLLIETFNEAGEFVTGLAQGNLDVNLPTRNLLISPFKQLHASLRHLTWQTGRIAQGDYSQRVDFMGDFSVSFNSMVEALAEKARIEESLREARAQVRQLEGIIPICMYCKKIRNDRDYWEKLENYLSEHTDALFSHGICPECLEKNLRRNKSDV